MIRSGQLEIRFEERGGAPVAIDASSRLLPSVHCKRAKFVIAEEDRWFPSPIDREELF
jgi:hypothetical protein